MIKSRKDVIRELAEEASRDGKGKKTDDNKNKSINNKSIITNELLQEQMLSQLMNNYNYNDSENVDSIDIDDEDNDNNNDTNDEDNDNDDNDENEKSDVKKDNEIDNKAKESILRFLKCDDLIRMKKEELKELQDQRKPYEEFILSYLEKKDQPFINVKSGKLIKNKSETTAPLKLDIIKESIKEGIKNEKDMTKLNDVKCNDVTEKIIELMNTKRGKSTRTHLKRTFVKTSKAQKQKE